MLGTELARRLRATRPEDELVLLDMPAALAAPDDLADVKVLRGDIRDEALLREALDSPEVAIVHLASVVSAGAERDFDAALEVNVDGGRALVEACRAHATAPRLVFTSSLAVFGGELALGPVDDDTRLTPSTTYGATKAMLELLFADATRKGFLDARSARPPTVIVRPGAPNAAASSFASAVVREPLAGRASTLPVSLDLPTVVIGVDTTVGCLARLLEIDGDDARERPRAQPAGARRDLGRAAGGRARARRPGDARAARGRRRPRRREHGAQLADRLELVAGRRDRPAARRGRGGHRARLPEAHRAVSTEQTAAFEACERQDGAERTFPFGPQVTVFKIAGKIFAFVGARAHARADHAQVRPRARRDAARRAPAIDRGYHMDKRHWITITLDAGLPQGLIEELIEDSYDLVAPRRKA